MFKAGFKRGRLFLWLTFSGLVISGIGLYFCLPASFDDFPHPFNGAFRAFHGLTAILALLSLGQMWSEHIHKKIKKWPRTPDGVIHFTLWMLLIISGYCLYYYPGILPEAFGMGDLHLWLGIALLIFLPLHCTMLLRKQSPC